MPITKSPLRYPGGKTQMSKFVEHTIEINKLNDVIYCEPFSGGAGVAMELLLTNKVNSIILNDLDIAIYSFWYALLNETKKFIKTIQEIPINLDTWYEQKNIYNKLKDSHQYKFELATATFFLNRTNRSGIITGGPIGGYEQKGKYKIDCRFNKPKLIKKFEEISKYANHIRLYNLDAINLINDVLLKEVPNNLFIFLDPPYYKQGKNLYKNSFDHDKHIELSTTIKNLNKYHWITTYDNNKHIEEIYNDIHVLKYTLQYSANKKRKEQEIFFHNPKTKVESFDKVFFNG